MGRLRDKVAIVTGGASGMGLAAVELFLSEGAKVVAGDRSVDQLAGEAERINNSGLLAVELDVASEESWTQLVEQTIATFGRTDILINNAGIHLGPRGVLDEDMDGWNTVLGVDLTGVWLGMKAVIPSMQAVGGGSIVNTSSIGGIVGGIADGGGAAYSAAKGGVRSITKHAAQNFAKDNIRVNSVHPGVTATGGSGGDYGEEEGKAIMAMITPQVPLPPHIGQPIDIAYGYLYLASDEAQYVTGSELVIDGGWTSH